jgi:hypothetical protein
MRFIIFGFGRHFTNPLPRRIITPVTLLGLALTENFVSYGAKGKKLQVKFSMRDLTRKWYNRFGFRGYKPKRGRFD